MRIVKQSQSRLGQVDIAKIEFDARSRDDIPALLKGLQFIYINEALRTQIFTLLEDSLNSSARKDTGRPGMELWQVFVLATLKLGLNCDFDRLQELANHHNTLREMLGHSGWEDPHHYKMQTLIDKTKPTLDALAKHDCAAGVVEIEHYIQHAERQIDFDHGWSYAAKHRMCESCQIERRVLKGEVIPHEEKVFSLFEPHTEWVSKGKAGVPVELGVRVCVIEDQDQFVLHHRIMWNETDDKVAVEMVDAAQRRYPQLNQCSFDKGFYTPNNLKELSQRLDRAVLPKKGRLNKDDQAREQDEDFLKARKQHAGVESCINNLEVRGLDRCLSYGKSGFERHVALSIVSCNLHRVGLILQRKERARLQRAERRRQRQLAVAA
jgi:hypothetical protein